MVQPKWFIHLKHPNKVCKVNRSIYGLKQSYWSWNLGFDEKIYIFFLLLLKTKPSHFIIRENGIVVVLLILHVNDMLLIRNCILTFQGINSYLGMRFYMKDLGGTTYILIIKIWLISIHESTYIYKSLRRFNIQDYKRRNILMQHHIVLRNYWSPITPSEVWDIVTFVKFLMKQLLFQHCQDVNLCISNHKQKLTEIVNTFNYTLNHHMKHTSKLYIRMGSLVRHIGVWPIRTYILFRSTEHTRMQ